MTKHDFRFAAALAVAFLMLAVTAPPADAAKVRFGDQEYLEKIQDSAVKGPNGEALYLGYKYTHHNFIAPYYLSDDGYILGVPGERRYFKLDAAMIERFQSRGLLPKPLPPYSIGLFDYVIGYLLWIVLAGIGLGIWVSMRKDKKQKAAIPIAQEAIALEQAGDVNGAIAKYDEALQIAPAFADVLCRRADCHQRTGNIDQAIADYSKAISADPKNAVTLLNRGKAFEAKQLMPQAIADYSRAVKLTKAPFVHTVRGDAYGRSGDHAAAIKDFSAAIKKEPDFAAAYDLRAQVYEAMGDQPRAAADRAKLAELAARQAPAGTAA